MNVQNSVCGMHVIRLWTAAAAAEAAAAVATEALERNEHQKLLPCLGNFLLKNVSHFF